MGGTADRMFVGHEENFMWSYRDYPLPGAALPEKVQPCHVKRDGSVFEVIKDWNRRYKDAGSAIKICARVSKICLYRRSSKHLWQGPGKDRVTSLESDCNKVEVPFKSRDQLRRHVLERCQ